MDKNRSKALVAVLFSFFVIGTIQAQESVNGSGGDASGSGGTVSYSVGQLTYHEYNSAAGSVAQGVQHAYEIVNLSVGDIPVSIAVTAYPNPTADYLMLTVSEENQLQLSYELVDINGKQLSSNTISENQEKLNMQEFAPATYFINVFSDNQIIQTFKVIKN